MCTARDTPGVSRCSGGRCRCNLARVSTRRHLTALPGTNGDRLLTVPEVAERLKCSRRTVFRLFSENALPSIKTGRQRLVSSEDVDAYLRRLLEAARTT